MTAIPALRSPSIPVQACGVGTLNTRRAYAQGPFGQVHFHEAGPANGVPLVLLHQAPVSARQFEPVYARLAARGVRAIGVDMPGFGFSDPTPFVPGIEDYARAIPAVLDALGLAKASILGHHTGALVATEVALQFPGRIDRLVPTAPYPSKQPSASNGWSTAAPRSLRFASCRMARTSPSCSRCATVLRGTACPSVRSPATSSRRSRVSVRSGTATTPHSSTTMPRRCGDSCTAR